MECISFLGLLRKVPPSGWFKTRDLLFHSSRGYNPKIKIMVGYFGQLM